MEQMILPVFRLRSTVSICYNPLPTDPSIYPTGTSVSVVGSINLRNDSGVLEHTWECFVDHISIGKTTPQFANNNNMVLCKRAVLVDGPHLLTVNATVANKQTFWFDRIQYVPSAGMLLASKAILVDCEDKALQYDAEWEWAAPGGIKMTGKTGSVFNFEFDGESARRPFCSSRNCINTNDSSLSRCHLGLVWIYPN